MTFASFAKRDLLFFILGLLAYSFCAYWLVREDIVLLLAVFFGISLLVFKRLPSLSLKQIFWSGLLFRMVFIGAIPQLSQDFYRFIWDGLLLHNESNPYAYIPSEVPLGSPYHGILLEKMGTLSAENHSNYPPVNQFGFWIATALFPNSLWGTLLSMRTLLILADLGIFYFGTQLLTNMQLDARRIGWYFLHPLVIIELTGNLHWEGMMLFFFVFGWWLAQNKKYGKASLSFALAVGTKLIPLLVYPLFIRFYSYKVNLKMGAIGMTALVGLFYPFFYQIGMSDYFSTLQLWFKQFEFNGSIYYIIRWFGYQIKGYNIIRQWGEIVPWLVIGITLIYAFLKKKKTASAVFTSMLFVLSWYYFLASIVHPWYLTSLILLSTFTSYRFPLVWGSLVSLSYFTYSQPNFAENFWFIGLEYGIVFYLLAYEWRKKRALFHHFE